MPAFKLIRTKEHNRTGRADALPVAPGFGRHRFTISRRLELDEPILMRAFNRDLARLTDHPSVGHPVQVFSKRMIERLTMLGGFGYETYDVLLVNGRGEPITDGARDFALFQTLDKLDVLDRRDAEYTTTPEDRVDTVHRLALLEPPGGFPAVFRVKWASNFGPIFNEDARAALDALTGFRLIPVPTRREDPAVR